MQASANNVLATKCKDRASSFQTTNCTIVWRYARGRVTQAARHNHRFPEYLAILISGLEQTQSKETRSCRQPGNANRSLHVRNPLFLFRRMTIILWVVSRVPISRLRSDSVVLTAARYGQDPPSAPVDSSASGYIACPF